MEDKPLKELSEQPRKGESGADASVNKEINNSHRQSFRVKNGRAGVTGDGSASAEPDGNGPEPKEEEPVEVPQVVHGKRPGDRYIRVIRPTQAEVQRAAPRYVQLSEESLAGRGSKWRRLKRFLIGRPIATAHASHERLNKIKALAVFASDALSSVAYATEAALFVLVTTLSSSQPISYIIPISVVIC